MKKVIGLVFALALLSMPAFGWNCSDPSAERVDVGSTLPAGATAGDGDGQYYKGTDAANPNDYYVCEVVKPTPVTTPTGGNSNATSQSTSTSQSASNSASQSSATGGKSNSVSNATGGSGGTSNATGGSATGGSAVAGVSNAGNSYSTNNNQSAGGAGGAGGNATATGGNQKQTQSQTLSNSGNSTATASGNGVGNGNNSNNYTNTSNTNVPAAAASAYAPPAFSSATCFKGTSVGASAVAGGISFGGGKIDQNCAELEAARQAPNLLTFCTQYIRVKYVKEAGVTLEMCMQPKIVAPVVVQPPTRMAPDVQPIVVNVQPVVVPAPVVNVIAPAPAPSVIVKAAPAKPRVPRSNNKCVPHECPPSQHGTPDTPSQHGTPDISPKEQEKIKKFPTVWNEDMVEGLRNQS